jgi:hypothetical protein
VGFAAWKWGADLVTIEYTLFESIVALSSDLGVTHIPAGAVVEARVVAAGFVL